ncbi:MAG: YCF48-related protein [Vicinamibacterales bacterium]
MTNPQRDAQLEQWLRGSSNSATAETPDCLDFEALAALVDNGLGRTERERALLHVAGCARCQSSLAALGRTFDVPATVATDSAETSISRWWRWLVPATAAATAVVALAVWVRTPVPPSSPASISSGSATSSAPSQPASEESPAREQSAASTGAPGAHEPTSGAASANAMRAPEAGSEARRLRSAPATAGPATERFSAEAPAAAKAKAAEANSAQPANPPVAVLRSAPEQAPAALAAPPPASPAAAADSVAAAAPAPASAPGAATARPAAAPRAAEQRANADAARPLAERTEAFTGWTLVSAPGGTLRWRFADTRVERSSDGGTTWQVAAIQPPAAIRAGSAAFARVCWLVGQGGLVLRTVDGDTWQRVPFPESADVTAVAATDANRARVTLADGRTFATTDAGRTWTRQ